MSLGDLPAESLREEKEALDLMKSGQAELARYKYAKLCKKHPSIPKFHFNYALVLYKLKRYEEALEEINAGLWLKPDDLKATKFKHEINSLVLKARAEDRQKVIGSGTISPEQKSPQEPRNSGPLPEVMPAVASEAPKIETTKAEPVSEVMPVIVPNAPKVEEPKPIVEAPKIEEPKPIVEEPKPAVQAPKVEESKPVVEAPKIEESKLVVEEPKPAVQAPKVEESKPAVQAPKVEEPKPVEESKPVVEAPKIEEPKPVVEAPKVEESKPVVEAPKIEEPKPAVQAPKVEESKPVVEAPKVEEPEPVVEAPKIEESKLVVEEPKPAVQAPKVEEPKPVVEAPKIEEPKPVVEAPKIEESKPVVEEPKPAEQAPKVEEPKPVVEAPKIEEPKPVVEAPKVEETEPVVEAPKIEEPKPVMEAPKVEEPEPVVEAPQIEEPKPVVEAPKVEEPEPVVEAPKIEEPKPVVEAPKVEESKPVVEEPKPAVQAPKVEESKPVVEAPKVEEPKPKHLVDDDEPELITEPIVMESIPGPEIKSEQPETIEVEPRITILEQAATITISETETNAETESLPVLSDEAKKQESTKKEQPKEIVEVKLDSISKTASGNASCAAPASQKPDTQKPGLPSGRLVNLKDLFASKQKRVETQGPKVEHDAILEETIEICPQTEEIEEKAVDEHKLVTFTSFKELNSYKTSIQALVVKYLTKKIDREVKRTDSGRTVPSSEPSKPLTEMEILPSIVAGGIVPGNADVMTEKPVTSSAPEMPAVVSPSENRFGALANVVKAQDGIIAIIQSSNPATQYPIQIDLKKHIEQKVLAKAAIQGKKLVAIKGEVLSQIIDMESYMTLVRLNRNYEKNKQKTINDLKGKELSETIASIEAAKIPFQGYTTDQFLKEESIGLEQQMTRIATGDQLNLTEEALNKIVAQVKEIGEDAGGSDPQFRDLALQIKKLAHSLYENAQYEQSVIIYSTFLTYFPEDFESLFNVGFCQREIGNFKESEKIFKRIIELFYDNGYAWYNLALIYAITNEGDKEAYCLQKARDFGYAVDINRLSRLSVTYEKKNPFDFE
nr:tetratricopeptide repeat protein [Candidatus Sigynarchaeota archaeon]